MGGWLLRRGAADARAGHEFNSSSVRLGGDKASTVHPAAAHSIAVGLVAVVRMAEKLEFS